MDSLIRDLKFSVRMLLKRPGMSLMLVCTLILGIGMNTAIFTIVRSVIIRPLPFEHPERLVIIRTNTHTFKSLNVSYPNYLDWKRLAHSFTHLAVTRRLDINITGSGYPERIFAATVSASYFKTLGVAPRLGRDFTDEDDRYGANRVAIISDGLWERHFGRAPGIIGRVVDLNNEPYTIIGVTPSSQNEQVLDVWLPIGLFADSRMMDRTQRLYVVLGRLAPGVTLKQAQREMEAVSKRLTEAYPDGNTDIVASVMGIMEAVIGTSRLPLLMMLGASFTVLLLACINLSTILMGGVIERQSELSLRLALGAKRVRLFKQLLVQMLMIALIGGSLGLLVAYAGVGIARATLPNPLPRFQQISVDSAVLWFSVAVSLLTVLVAGLLPVVYATRLNINLVLKKQAGGSMRSALSTNGQRALIVLQVSLAVALTITAGLLIKSLHNLTRTDLGFDPTHVLSFQLSLPEGYKKPLQVSQFYERLINELQILPGVHSVSAVSQLPMQSFYYSVPLWIKGNETAIASQHRFVDTMAISPDYFKTLKIPILAGRAFTAADRENHSQVIIVDDVVAKQMWPGESAIGKQVVLNEFDENPDLQVIGVVPQVKKYGPDQEVPRNQVYRPLMQYPQKYMSVVIDYDGDLEALKRAAQEKVYRMDKTVPLYNIQTLEKLFSVVIGNRTASAALLVSFAGAALLLSIIGIYGVVSNWVVRRRQELAIRLALGSSLAGVKRLIIRQVAVCAVPAILLGSILVLVFSRSLSGFLVGVHGSDPGTHFVAVTSIAGVIFVASLRSLRRLLRVDPQELMKE